MRVSHVTSGLHRDISSYRVKTKSKLVQLKAQMFKSIFYLFNVKKVLLLLVA